MKHALTILILICSFHNFSFSQTSFIEVEVSDTIEIKADVFICEFTLFEQENNFGFEDTTSLNIGPDELDKIITSYSDIKIISDNPGTNSMLMRMTITKRKVITRSHSSLKSLVEELNSYANVNLSDTQLVVEASDEAEIILKEKLIAKSKQKALQTAQIINKELGDLVKVKEFEFMELTEDSMNSESSATIYPPLSALGDVFKTTTEIPSKSVFSKKLVVKYLMN